MAPFAPLPASSPWLATVEAKRYPFLHDGVNPVPRRVWAHAARSTTFRPMKFGAEVRRRRKAAGWTLEVLAERADLSTHYLSTVETNQRDPSLSTVEKLAGAFGIGPGELLGASAELTPEGLEAGKLVEALPPRIREATLVMLTALVGRTAKRR